MPHYSRYVKPVQPGGVEDRVRKAAVTINQALIDASSRDRRRPLGTHRGTTRTAQREPATHPDHDRE